MSDQLDSELIDLILRYIQNHGIEGALILVLVLFLGSILLDPTRAEKWASLFFRVVYRVSRRGELRIVQHDVNGHVNRFLQAELFPALVGSPELRVRVEWVGSAGHRVFERKGTVIVKLRHHEEKYHNVLAATLTALPRVAHPLVRPFLGSRIEEAVDLQICRRLADTLGPSGRNVFALEFLRPRLAEDAELQRVLAQLLSIDLAGLFVPIFLQELTYLGGRLQPAEEAVEVDEEVKDLIHFLLAIAEKEPGEDLPTLCFVRDQIKVGIILLARQRTRTHGVTPYVRRLGKDFAIGCETVYLLTVGGDIGFAKKVRAAIEEDRRAIFEKEGTVEIEMAGKPERGYYAGFRLDKDYLTVPEFADVVAELGLEVGSRVRGVAVNVGDECAHLNFGGLLARLDRSDASWRHIRSCREVLVEGDQVEVEVLRVTVPTRNIEVGLKQVAEENPWPEITKRYPPGTRLSGPVVRVEPHGVYVEIEPGLEGLVHETSLRAAGFEYADFTRTMVPGQTLFVVVRRVWIGKERIALDLERSHRPPAPTEILESQG